MKDFTKEDLKDGMICTARNQVKAVIFNGGIWRDGKTRSEDSFYNDDLTCDHPPFDIIKVEHSTGEVIFHRDEWIELTPREAFDLMEGYGSLDGEYGVNTTSEWITFTVCSVSPYRSLPFLDKMGAAVLKFRIKASEVDKIKEVMGHDL